CIGRLVEVIYTKPIFDLVYPVFQYRNGALLFIDFIIGVALESRCKFCELGIPTRYVAFGWPGDKQRGAGFVNENGIKLVDDRKTMSALDHVVFRLDHVVP